MSIHITKKGIRAIGSHANGLMIALAGDDQIIEWASKPTQAEEFQRMVKEAMTARGLQYPKNNDQP